MNKRLLLVSVAVVLGLLLLFVAVRWLSRRGDAAPVAAAVRESDPFAAQAVKDAAIAESKGDLAAAKAQYQKLISEFAGSQNVMSWQKKVEEINIKQIISEAGTAQSAAYEIKPGDRLVKIAANFKTTVELIKKANGLKSDMIMPGRKIKVQAQPFSIFVDKSQNILLLKCKEEVIKTYVVSTGKDNCTPVGTFKITNKLANPTWFKSGAVVPPESPDNILGSRWLGFNLAGYGIHGTTMPESLGTQATQGCVRMSNTEVEELYILVPVGTEVTIVD